MTQQYQAAQNTNSSSFGGSGHSFTMTRLWIKISSYFGIFVVSLLAFLYFYTAYRIGHKEGKNPGGLIVTSFKDLTSSQILLFIGLILTTLSTIVCNIGLIRYASLPDNQFLANKWSLAVLSLSIGGFLAPWFLIHLPNVDTKATKNARVTIVKYMGTSWYLGCLFAGLGLIILKTLVPVGNRTWASNGPAIFWGVTGGLLALGSILVAITVPFYGDRVEHIIATKSSGYRYYQTVATIFTFIVTIMLVISIITAILRVLSEFSRAFQAQNGIETFFLVISALLQAVYTAFLIYMIIAVIKGLWQSTDDGLLTIKRSQRFARSMDEKQARTAR